MEFKPKKCEKCGAYLVLRESGDVPTRLAPLNWWECPNCGRQELDLGVITTTTNTRDFSARELRKIADHVNKYAYTITTFDLFDYLYDIVLQSARMGKYESNLVLNTKDFAILQSVCARFEEIGCRISCISQDETQFKLTINF